LQEEGHAHHHHPGIEGRTVTEYLGVVTAQGVLGVNAFKDVGAGMRNIFGGRSKSCENELASGSAMRWPSWSNRQPTWASTRSLAWTSTMRPSATTC
jgi:Putative heavy-metal-binding